MHSRWGDGAGAPAREDGVLVSCCDSELSRERAWVGNWQGESMRP